MGNGVWHASSYNLRLQVCGIQDVLGGGQTWNGASCSSAPITGGTSLLTATLNWGTANNNGNLQGASYVNSGPGFATPLPFAQGYTYDTVNRLTGVSDTGYTRNFQYDAFGNMYISGSSVITPQGNAPKVANLYNGYNQFIGGAYDAAGNQTVVNGNTITYDAENREAVVAGLGINETYLYDGDGRRVAKGVTGNSPNTVFVYDAMGQLAAEYSTTTNSSPCRTCYLSDDHLGTARLVMDGQGNVVARHDYLPFGEEIAAGQAGRTSQWGPGNDTVNQKFTGKERDSESGLDYFGARYYGSALGRFTSVDPEGASASLFDPQRWNGYSYAVNNPYKFVDRDGEVPVLLVTAAIGAGVGAVGGAGFDITNQLIQNGWDFSAINGREVAGATVGGLVSGGLAGLTLGLLPAPATLTTGYLVTSAVVNGAANVAGGEVQRSIDPSASGSAVTDFAAGAVGGAVGTKIAYARYPLPNVKKELAIIAQSNRRSLRPQRVADFNRYADQQTIRNNTAGSVAGTSVANFISDLWSDLTSYVSRKKEQEPKACVTAAGQTTCDR